MVNKLAKIAEIGQQIQMRKEFLNLRGKEFLSLYDKYQKLWSGYFEKQVDEYIQYLENNPQLVIEIKKATVDFEKENEDQLLAVYELGMTIEEAEVQKQMTFGVSIGIDLE